MAGGGLHTRPEGADDPELGASRPQWETVSPPFLTFRARRVDQQDTWGQVEGAPALRQLCGPEDLTSWSSASLAEEDEHQLKALPGAVSNDLDRGSRCLQES